MFDRILDVLLDALKDSAIILPILFVCYLLIELLEEKILVKYQSSKGLKSKFAPVVSAGFGLIPQCGFSVVATDLYSRRIITLGSLFAIYIATSDEALPLLLSDPNSYLSLGLILLIKFVYAIAVGLTIDLIVSKIKVQKQAQSELVPSKEPVKVQDGIHKEEPLALDNENIEGCCKHKLEHEHNKFKETILHPLIHSLKLFAFILAMNVVFGLIIEFVGEDVIASFMTSTGFFEPFIVSFVGLIPNCFASVIVTKMFMMGSITLGSCVAGLCVNSGIAMVVLFKNNKNIKENLAILSLLYVLACFIGIIINLF